MKESIWINCDHLSEHFLLDTPHTYHHAQPYKVLFLVFGRAMYIVLKPFSHIKRDKEEENIFKLFC